VRLLFVIENDEPHASGGGYYAPFKFAEFLARRGHDVLVYATHDLGWAAPGSPARVIYRPSLPRSNRILGKADKAIAAFCRTAILARAARAHRPEWVLGVLKESAIAAVEVGRLVGARVANFVYECPPWLLEMFGPEAAARDDHPYTRDLWERTRRAYLASDMLFPNSELSRDWNSRWLDGRVMASPIHPGIDPDLMPVADAGAGASVPADGGVSRPPGEVLYVGRLAPAKNVDLLIAACLRLDPRPMLHICGEGPEMRRLVALARGEPRVVFHGYVSDADLWARYRAADLVVMPSSFEGFGMPPMQALYFGKPALVSDIPIFRSVYGDHLEYAPPGDVAALGSAIRALLADPAYRRERGIAGRRFVLEHFTWSEAARRIESALAAAPARVAKVAEAARPAGALR
jgi:glycosyltransferase involved in cell wall biosynthesis